MHSGDLAELEKSDLSEQEKEALLQVMQRAKVSWRDAASVRVCVCVCVCVSSAHRESMVKLPG